jgi:Protein of unknown function (DUF2587)
MSDRRPEVIVPGQQPPGTRQEGEEEVVARPAKLIRIASMIRELLEETRRASLDEEGKSRLQEIYNRSVGELQDALTPDLRKELDTLATPLQGGSTEAEIRVAQAQLLGWLEGLFHGIQAALWAQHMQAQAALEEMRRRGLPAGMPGGRRQPPGAPQEGQPQEPQGPPGQYL